MADERLFVIQEWDVKADDWETITTPKTLKRCEELLAEWKISEPSDYRITEFKVGGQHG